MAAAAVLALALPSQAKAPFVKAARDLGFTHVTNCASCHQGPPKKMGLFTRMGQYLVDQKAARKAAEIDLNWLKGYKQN
jgi:cytochrome c peroxidase